ncbi:tyrosine-type recombinase/integrase [Paracoccus sp. S-4012]|uniref:tyrosine-type recombinase/integrase n=1 Tax=Paracoccus sp. S-4012 TaxID=2665648 RepID=UPI0012B07CC0|nr:tyrosine-type recombinase/integrase [Paracoccus sp. S-4012]MRX52296.1 tyrosine-type recombinase/integrase [Paracoccus sp. S-4012]
MAVTPFQLLQWGSNNGFIEHNPAKGVRVDTGRVAHKKQRRLPFDHTELKGIFGTDLFKEPKSYETRQWALLIALFTGARSSSEVSRIKLSDLREEQGVIVFDLEEASKNERSKRLVPVHSELIALGLPAYAYKLRKRGEIRLFPDWEPEDKVNRRFLRTYLPKLGIAEKSKVFHSFRHNLKTELIRTGCTKEVSDLITGHEDQSVAAGYVHDVPVKRMQEALDRVSFRLPIVAITIT